jgi:hypothetical protein
MDNKMVFGCVIVVPTYPTVEYCYSRVNADEEID